MANSTARGGMSYAYKAPDDGEWHESVSENTSGGGVLASQ